MKTENLLARNYIERADKKEGSEAKLNVVAAVIGGGVKVEKQEATLRH